jgi:hypothetical protein
MTELGRLGSCRSYAEKSLSRWVMIHFDGQVDMCSCLGLSHYMLSMSADVNHRERKFVQSIPRMSENFDEP